MSPEQPVRVERGGWAVVIPSNRALSAVRLAAIPADIPVLVVEDGPGAVVVDRPGACVFTQDFQRRYMGPHYDLIPRGTAACRNFAFYYLWRETDVSFVISLDDDVATRPGFVDAYRILGTSRPLPTAHGAPWLNTIGLFEAAPDCYARGYPYEERAARAARWCESSARVVCHMGLWDRVLDTHALDKQLFDAYRSEYPDLTPRRPLVRVGCDGDAMRFPFSSMNFGFVRDALPAMYQMPMRPRFTDRYALWRYDDIWSGYVMQSLAAKRGDAVTVGGPVVEHQKAGDLQRELLGEHYGVLMSPYLYAVLDRAVDDVRPGGYLEMYQDLMDRVQSLDAAAWQAARVPALYRDYFLELTAGLARWARLCAASPRPDGAVRAWDASVPSGAAVRIRDG